MSHKITLVLLFTVFSLLNACASYVPPVLRASDIRNKHKVDSYIDTIVVQPSDKVNGGLIQSIKDSADEDKAAEDENRIHFVERFNIYPKWRETLERAVTVFGIFNIDSKHIYALRVNVFDIKFPSSGGNFPTDIVAHYEILDTSTSAVIFSKIIRSHAEAEVNYGIGTYRWKDALDRSVNNNVKTFIEEYLKSKPG